MAIASYLTNFYLQRRHKRILHIALVPQSVTHYFVHAALHKQMMDYHRAPLSVPVQPLVGLLILLQAPGQPEPNHMMASELKIQPVPAAGRMSQQNVNLSSVPGPFILDPGVLPDPQPRLGQSREQPIAVMLKAVEHQGVLPVQLLDQLHKSL